MPSTPKSKKIVRLSVAVIVLLTVLIAVLLVMKALHKEKVAEEVPTVEVANVEVGDVSIYGEYVGRIRAQQIVEVRALVDGYLESMKFSEGSYIRKGQTLFTIDPTLYKAKAEKARAQLDKAVAAEDKARRDLERIRPLYEQNAASRLDLDNAIAAYETAKAEVLVRKAELTEAQVVLSGCNVTSPISGYISERNADIGAMVGPGGISLLATVVNSDTVRVDFSMTALDYLNSRNRNVTIGAQGAGKTWQQYVTVTLPDGSIYPYRGIVDFADPKVDPKTGTFQVRAEMPNPERALLSGEFTRVKLLMDVRENVISIPSKALEIEKGGAYVYVVRPDNIVERRFVETGPESGNNIVIERGLAVGERIIVEGYNKVKNGMKVNPVSTTPGVKVDVLETDIIATETETVN